MSNRPQWTVWSRRSALGVLAAAPVIAGAAASPAAAGPRTSRATNGDLPRELLPGGVLDRFIARRAAADQFSGTVLLTRGGRTVLSRSYGMTDRDTGTANGADTVYMLASITKCLTAVAVAQLVQRGMLRLDEKLGGYLDGLPAGIADAVTLRHLLTHTSGVGREPTGGQPPPPGLDSVAEVWEYTMSAIRAVDGTFFPPGSAWKYSNDGFWLLGAIVRQVSGQTYYDYVGEHVLAPARMTGTAFLTKPQVLAATNVAHPYYLPMGGAEREDLLDSQAFPFVGGADGGACAPAPDLIRFVRALHDGTLLAPEYARLITTGKVDVPPGEDTDPAFQRLRYGYGFFDSVYAGHRLVWHSGSAPGRDTMLDIYPELGWVCVVLGNYDKSIGPIIQLGRQLITASTR